MLQLVGLLQKHLLQTITCLELLSISHNPSMQENIEKYRLLNGDDLSVDEELEKANFRPSHSLIVFLVASLILSLSFNIGLTFNHIQDVHEHSKLNSEYAYVQEKEILSAWHFGPENYSSDDHATADELWQAVDENIGIVAIPMDWAKEKGLPETCPYPWDESKGIYLLNGYHNLHCVKRIYISMKEYRDGLPQSLPYEHLVHCLDSLRQDILCTADDTPRYITCKQSDSHYGGDKQIRQCRDWNKLEAWAKEHTGCFRYGDPTWDQRSQFERYKFCPNDSPYLPHIRTFFEKDEAWLPGELEY